MVKWCEPKGVRAPHGSTGHKHLESASAMTTQHDTGSVEYRTVERIEGYRFGDDGSLWSCWRKGGGGPIGRWKRLSPGVGTNGYHNFRPLIDGKRVTVDLPRIILEAFVGPAPDGMEVCHGDRDKGNNRLSNLRWGTREENIEDSRRHGTCPIGIPGKANRMAKVTEDDIPTIRRLASEGMKYQDIAVRYNLHKTTVGEIVRRDIWAHVV